LREIKRNGDLFVMIWATLSEFTVITLQTDGDLFTPFPGDVCGDKQREPGINAGRFGELFI